MEQFRSDKSPGGFVGIGRKSGNGSSRGSSGGSGDDGGADGSFKFGDSLRAGKRINTGSSPETPSGDVLGAFINRNKDTVDGGKRIPNAPASKQPKGKSTPEDEIALALFIIHISSAAAVTTGYMGWVFTQEEADTIASPASRVLARHKVAQSVVREFSDPLALIVAIGLPTYFRYLAYREWLRQSKLQRVQPTQPPPPQPAQNGAASPIPGVVDHLRGL